MLSRFADARILVIDDNAANVALLKALLTKSGIGTVESSTDPHEGLARLRKTDFDLVLLDLHMPQLDGYQILGELAARGAGTFLPVLVLTADATPEAAQRALSLGARDFVTKPFDTTQVLLRARNLLETAYLHRTLRLHNVALRRELGAYQELERTEQQSVHEQQETIHEVIRSGGIRIVYQPIFDISHGDIVGIEALSRFPQQPGGGPDLWFDKAAQIGLGPALEIAAMQAALAACSSLPPEVFLALNVSPATLLSPELPDLWADGNRSQVVLELTEHVPVEDYDTIGHVVNDLRRHGVRLAVDDMGAGYASFQHLLGLNPDMVKLDICLTRGIDRDPTRRALATALASFTRDTGRLLIAEGVETADESDALQQLGISWAQGYHLARPTPLAEINWAVACPG
jgi:EAL domain-containing protein (putative c-di-GMP-specific phosphodiesterase class I)/FixJ family two-component response regulator